MLKTNNEVRAYHICDSLPSPIHLCNRDASSVMLAGSQAWDWGFLTHHALFIVQSNRVCKMRITQHEENRGGKGVWRETRVGAGRRRGGQRWDATWKRGRYRREERVRKWTLSDLLLLFPLMFTPGLLLELVSSGEEEMNMEVGAPDSSTKIGSQFAFVKCASCESVCIPSTNCNVWAGDFRVLLRFVSSLRSS